MGCRPDRAPFRRQRRGGRRAAGIARWTDTTAPWAIVTGSTAWGREVASRIAARLGAGLTGDAVDLEVAADRLVAWKPAFGGQLVAAIEASSPIQMATVRPGMLPAPVSRWRRASRRRSLGVRAAASGCWHVRGTTTSTSSPIRDAVIGVGLGVPPDEYDTLEPLRGLLGAELGATRKVTDKGWLPRSRQVGITGRSIAPRLFVSIGASGKFNHAVGLRAAGTVLAINHDAAAPIFQAADVGIIGDWRAVLPLLVAELTASA